MEFWGVIICGIILLMQIVRGWSLGPVRMLCSFIALGGAYLAGVMGARLAPPVLRSIFQFPDFILMAIGGVGVGLLVYMGVSIIGKVIFKRTRDQESQMMRAVYGVSGAGMGFVFGMITLWVLVMGIKLMGTVAEARLKSETEYVEELKAAKAQAAAEGRELDLDVQDLGIFSEGPSPFLLDQLTKAKHTLEEGMLGTVVETVDVIPDDVYVMLGRIAQLVGNPGAVQRFIEFPGAKELMEHPKIQELKDNPEIMEAISRRQFLPLLSHPSIIEAANDPELSRVLKEFDLKSAMNKALSPTDSIEVEKPDNR